MAIRTNQGFPQIRIPNYGGGEEQEPRRRSNISGFAADGEGNFRWFGGSMESDALRSGYDGIVAQADAAAADRARRGRTTLSWAYGDAIRNNGRVRREVMPAINRELGSDFIGGVIMPDGGIAFGSSVANGKLVPSVVAKPSQVLASAVSSGDWDVADALANSNAFRSYTPEQMFRETGYSPAASRSGRQAKATQSYDLSRQKLAIDALKIYADMANDNQAPLTPEAFYGRHPELLAMVTDVYEEDKDGNIQLAENGAPVKKNYTPEEKARVALDFFNKLQGARDGATGGGMNDMQREVLGIIRNITAPEPVNPYSAAAAEENSRRAYIMNRPQVLRGWLGADGRRHYGNVYEVDGKIFDPRSGDEIVGATDITTDWAGRRPAQSPAQGGATAQPRAQPPAQGASNDGDEDITLPDGSQGKKHNGKTYRLKGVDKDGNKLWEPVK